MVTTERTGGPRMPLIETLSDLLGGVRALFGAKQHVDQEHQTLFTDEIERQMIYRELHCW